MLNEEQDGKRFAETIMKRCDSEQIKSVIAAMAYIILGEYGGGYDRLMKYYFPEIWKVKNTGG